MDQSCKSCFIIAFISALCVGLAVSHVADSATQQNFWKTMLPNTPMPQALLDALPKSGNADGAVNGNKASSKSSYKQYNDPATLPQNADQYNDDLLSPSTYSYKLFSPSLYSYIDPPSSNSYELPSPTSLLKQDVITSMFFLDNNLNPGTKLNIHFVNKVLSPPFLSALTAQKLPSLTSGNLPQLLEFFSVSPNSKTAKTMSQTVAKCEQPKTFKANFQYCATSLEKMVTLVSSKLGDSKSIRAISMTPIHTDALLPYKITSVRQIATEQSLVTCHQLSFPVGLYYCHQPPGVMAYNVSLIGIQDGVKTDAYALCHRHTSDWIPEYIAFKVLGVQPGATICHFNQLDNVIWYRD